MAPNFFNKLLKNWKQLTDVAFKKKVINFLADKAYYNVNEFLDERF